MLRSTHAPGPWRSARARAAARVARDRPRLPAAAPAGEPQPQPEVDVLEVGAEALVEAAHGQHGRAAVERGAGAGREDLAGRVVAALVALEAAALLARAVAAQDVAGVVEQRRVVEVDQLRRHRDRLRRRRQRGDRALEPVRGEHDVGVDQRHRLGAPPRPSPAFAVRAKPPLAPSASTRTAGWRSASSASDPSVEPSSTTSTSAGATVCAATLSSTPGSQRAPL